MTLYTISDREKIFTKIFRKYLEEIKKCVHLHPLRRNFDVAEEKSSYKNAAGICGIKNSDLSLQSVREIFADNFETNIESRKAFI